MSRLTSIILGSVMLVLSASPKSATAQVRAQPVGRTGDEAETAAEPEAEPEAEAETAAEPEADRAPRRQSDRPFYALAGAGVSIGLDAGAGPKMKLVQELGYHFLPFGDHPGLFAALTLGESFIDFTILQLGGRLGIDFALTSGSSFALLLTPSVASGLGLYVVPSSVIGTETRSYFDIQVAGDVKLVFRDGQLAAWLRPVSFDFFINRIVLTRYDILAGVQINF
jgi:hypothetical protein